MACTKEQIESKRLAALERIKSKRLSQSNDNFCSPGQHSSLHSYEKRFKGSGGIHQSDSSKYKFDPYSKKHHSTNSPNGNSRTVSLGKVISGTTYLISENRFEVKPSEYSDKLIQIFKTIPSKAYDAEKRLWNFSLDYYEELQKKILSLHPFVVLGPIPNYVLNTVREFPKENRTDLSRIDPELRNKLMPFQVDGVRFGIEKKGRCLIGDDMGLGKTFQALAIAHYYKEDWPLLIITTSSMRETWEIKIQDLLPSIPMPTIVCVSSGKEKQFLSDKLIQIIIISYKMATLCTNTLIEKKIGTVILDESHLLKSYKAQNTESVMKITKGTKRVVLLSGTPALSRPSELFTQLQIIDPKFFTGFTEFGKRYCAGKQTNFGWDMTGQSNLSELQIILQKKFLIRRTKDEVLNDLKEKTRESVILDSSLLMMNSQTQNDLSQLANKYSKKKSSEKHAALLAFFSESAKAKIPAICKYVKEIVSVTNEKFLIFAHHRIVLEAICYTLDENKVHYICIDGSTKSDHRCTLVDKFQYSDSCRAAVLSITAANAGITLTSAQLVIFAELHWNPGILTQAEARAHRIGQKGGVCVRYLLAKGTSDDFMWPMLENKLQVLNEAGLSKDTFENTTSKKQISNVNTIEKYATPSAYYDSKQKQCHMSKQENKKETLPSYETKDCLETSFLCDSEGDDMLANAIFL